MFNKTWHIAYISSIAGAFGITPTAISESGMIAWSGYDEYSVRLLDMDNDGEKLLLHIDPETTDENLSYQLAGYAAVNDLPFSITPWEQFYDC